MCTVSRIIQFQLYCDILGSLMALLRAWWERMDTSTSWLSCPLSLHKSMSRVNTVLSRWLALESGWPFLVVIVARPITDVGHIRTVIWREFTLITIDNKHLMTVCELECNYKTIFTRREIHKSQYTNLSKMLVLTYYIQGYFKFCLNLSLIPWILSLVSIRDSLFNWIAYWIQPKIQEVSWKALFVNGENVAGTKSAVIIIPLHLPLFRLSEQPIIMYINLEIREGEGSERNFLLQHVIFVIRVLRHRIRGIRKVAVNRSKFITTSINCAQGICQRCPFSAPKVITAGHDDGPPKLIISPNSPE